jgi:hypothetical protein
LVALIAFSVYNPLYIYTIADNGCQTFSIRASKNLHTADRVENRANKRFRRGQGTRTCGKSLPGFEGFATAFLGLPAGTGYRALHNWKQKTDDCWLFGSGNVTYQESPETAP